ncbi:MAG: class I adenylate-forming enzyme family protein [Streptosporangiaceae bacterium]
MQRPPDAVIAGQGSGILANPGGEMTTTTYGDLDRHSSRLASWLRRHVGVRQGGAVAVIPRNDAASIAAIFGVLRSGSPALLLSPADPVARLRSQAEAIGCEFVLRSPAVGTDVLPGSCAVPDPRTLPEDRQWRDPDLDPAADALFFGTSGSTATAKLVAQSHYNAAVNAAAVGRHHRLRRGDRIVGCLPIHHVNGLHLTLFGTLWAGGHVLLAQDFDPLRYPEFLRGFRPRIASVVPSLLEALTATWRKPGELAGFGYFVSAAAPLSTETARRVWQAMGVRVLQGYGLTETTNFATMMPFGLPPEAYRRLTTDAAIPSVGVALPGNEVAVLRPDGARADPGEAGEICVRGHNVMTGYVNNPQATAEAFRGGWFHSQDLGFEVADAALGRRFVVITGRSKNIAKVSGESVSLEEMERVLLSVPEVRDAACLSRPHRFYGEEIVVAVVLTPGARVDVRDRLRSRFPSVALPRRVVHCEAIPRTATGKILRVQLLAALTTSDGDGQ